MKLVVVIPALDEEATIADCVAGVPRSVAGIDAVEVVVVDDGSTDRTAELARSAGAAVVSHIGRRGVGAAFATGVDAALARGADIIVNMDGDGQFNPADIPALIAPILEHRAEFVTCTRFALPDYQPEMPRLKRWGNRWMCRLINKIIWNAAFTDVSCGFRAYSRDTALKLNLFGNFTYTQESFIDLAGKGVAMAEVPLKVRGQRQYGTSRVAGNLRQYAVQTGSIILRAMRDTRPLTFFGVMGLVLALLGLGQGVFVFVHWLRTGMTRPYQSLLLGAGVFLMMGFLLLVLALIADMLGRHRKSQDRLLYLAKREHYDRRRPGGG